MNGNCHFVFGAAVASAAVMNLDKLSEMFPQVSCDSTTATLLIMGGLLGSITPDIDNPTSHMGRLSYPVSKWISNIGALTGKEMMHHRGILHDLGLYLLALGLCYFYFQPLCGFFLGCVSHTFLDLFNPAGVPVFGRHLRLAKIKSGSKASIILTWICVGAALILGGCIRAGLSFF